MQVFRRSSLRRRTESRVDALIQLSRAARGRRRSSPRGAAPEAERQRLRIRPRRLGRGATVQRVANRQPRLVRQGDRRLVRGGREGDRRSDRERAGRGGSGRAPASARSGARAGRRNRRSPCGCDQPISATALAAREAVPRRAVFGADMLGPQIPLQPEDMLALASSQLRRQRVEGIDALQID